MKQTMKKLCALCASAMTLSLCSAMAAPLQASAISDTSLLMGDLDGDHFVTSVDAQSALKYYVDSLVGLNDGEVNVENAAADIDMNGNVDVMDATYILQYYCQTLVGDKPLWAEVRNLSYEDGFNYYDYDTYLRDEDGMIIFDESGQPTRIKANTFRKFELKGMYIEVGCAKGKAGETVKVPVYIAGLPAVAGFILQIDNDEQLKLVRMTSNLEKDYDNMEVSINSGRVPAQVENADFCRMVGVDEKGANCEFKDGYILSEILYQIPEDAESGQFLSVSVNPYETEFITTDCESYQYTKLDGVVYVD